MLKVKDSRDLAKIGTQTSTINLHNSVKIDASLSNSFFLVTYRGVHSDGRTCVHSYVRTSTLHHDVTPFNYVESAYEWEKFNLHSWNFISPD